MHRANVKTTLVNFSSSDFILSKARGGRFWAGISTSVCYKQPHLEAIISCPLCRWVWFTSFLLDQRIICTIWTPENGLCSLWKDKSVFFLCLSCRNQSYICLFYTLRSTSNYKTMIFAWVCSNYLVHGKISDSFCF